MLCGYAHRRLEAIKARVIIDHELLFRAVAQIFSLEENIHRTVEPVPVRDIGAIEPAIIPKFLNGERQQLFIHLEAEIDLSPFDILLRPQLSLIASVKILP